MGPPLSVHIKKELCPSRLPIGIDYRRSDSSIIKTSSVNSSNRYSHWAVLNTLRQKAGKENSEILHDSEAKKNVLRDITRNVKIEPIAEKHIMMVRRHYSKMPIYSRKVISRKIVRRNKGILHHHNRRTHSGTHRRILRTKQIIIRRQIVHIRHSSSHPVPVSESPI